MVESSTHSVKQMKDLQVTLRDEQLLQVDMRKRVRRRKRRNP